MWPCRRHDQRHVANMSPTQHALSANEGMRRHDRLRHSLLVRERTRHDLLPPPRQHHGGMSSSHVTNWPMSDRLKKAGMFSTYSNFSFSMWVREVVKQKQSVANKLNWSRGQTNKQTDKIFYLTFWDKLFFLRSSYTVSMLSFIPCQPVRLNCLHLHRPSRTTSEASIPHCTNFHCRIVNQYRRRINPWRQYLNNKW